MSIPSDRVQYLDSPEGKEPEFAIQRSTLAVSHPRQRHLLDGREIEQDKASMRTPQTRREREEQPG